MSTEVANRKSSVPALAPTPALQFDAGDLPTPRVYVAQSLSNAVTEGHVKVGDIYSSAGQDDPEPTILWESGSDKPGTLFHILTMRKGKSLVVDGDLQRFDFDDPEAPFDANTTWDYTISLPEIDEDLPYKFLLKSSNGSDKAQAQKINMILAKNSISGPAWATAFRITSAEKVSKRVGKKYFVAQVRAVEPNKKHVELAERTAMLVVIPGPAPAPRGDQPAI